MKGMNRLHAPRCRGIRSSSAIVRRGSLWVAVLTTLAARGACEAAAAESAERIFRNARSYTVRIKTQIEHAFGNDTQGSHLGAGFVVDAARGWILTNAHVTGESPSVVTVAFADEPFQPARKIYVDPFADVAILAVARAQGRRAALLACDRELAVGGAVGVFGHPLGIPFTGSRGIISGRTDKFGPELVQMDATIDEGNSGGPVIDLRDGRVIGIATAGATRSRADRLNFATPMKDVCKILDLLRRGIRPEPPRIGVALLHDEDERCTMRVGAVYDAERWPLRPGDRLLGIGGADAPLSSISHLVHELRGRTGRVPLVIERDGVRTTVGLRPDFEPTITERRGVIVDGALIAHTGITDASELGAPPGLVVHSVESGSTAEGLGIMEMDMLESVDGRAVADLDALIATLRQRTSPTPMVVTFRRWSGKFGRIFEYQVRAMPGEVIETLSPDGASLSLIPE